MSDTSQHPAPLSRTLFPFPKPGNGGNGQTQLQEASAKEYFQALSEAEDGFFPIGYNGQWHGGIHFGAETGRSLAQDGGLRCIADGQVIAYRIDEDYPTVKYDSCPPATYSRGFVLVRHRLQLPPAPRTAGASGERTTAADAEPSLLFFSLYMHLRNWNVYKANADLKRPAFWDGSVYLVGERAIDSDRTRNAFIPESGGTGMNIRDANHRIAGFAPRGVKLKLGEANSARSSYYRITEVLAGTTYPDDLVGMYIYKGTGSSREGLDPISEPHATGTVYIPPEPVEIQAGDIVGHLGEYQRYLDMDALAQCSSGRPLAQMDVFTHEDLAGFIAQSRSRDAQLDARQKTLLHVRPGARLVQPSKPDIELEAGEAVVQIEDDGGGRWVMGRKGTVAIVDQRAGGFNAATRTYGDGRIFIAAVDAEGNEITLDEYNALPDKTSYPRRKLLTPTGSEVWVSRGTADQQALVTSPGRAWSRSPLQAANARGEAVGYSRVIPVAAIEESLKEADGTRWFQVDAATSSGQLIRGWARESGHPNVEMCSPWAWPGFELFDVAELEPRELFARELATSGRAQPQERDEFDTAASNIEQSPLFDALGRVIDSDENREITALELRNALKTDWLADAISRLVIRYPSEWSDPTDRWSRIDELIEDEVLRRDWEHEKGRIGELVIWPDVAGKHGFPADSAVHHFHPVGFIESFLTQECCRLDAVTFKAIFGDRQIFSHRDMPTEGTSFRASVDYFVDLLNTGFEKFGFTKCRQKFHFLAQCYHESDHFITTQEYASGWDYDLSRYPDSVCDPDHAEYTQRKCRRRKQILAEGNTSIGDGPKYKGRGIIQLTWKGTYSSFGNYAKKDLVNSPDSVASDLSLAVESAFWFWSIFKGEHLNAKVERFYSEAEQAGLMGDALDDEVVRRITRVVNGGDRGLAERQALYRKIRDYMI